MTESEPVYLSRRERREAERALGADSLNYVDEVAVDESAECDLVESSAETSRNESIGGVPSRRELRRMARETGTVPFLTAEMLAAADNGELTWENPGVAAVETEVVETDAGEVEVVEDGAGKVEVVDAEADEVVEREEVAESDSTEAEEEPDVQRIEVPAASPEIPPAREGDWREQLEADDEHEWVTNHPTGTGIIQSPALQTLVVDSYATGDISTPINPTGEILITGQILIDPIGDDEPAADVIDAGVDENQPGIPRRASEALSIIGRSSEIAERKKIPSVGSAVAAGAAAFLGIAVIALGLLAYFTDIL